MSDFEAALQLLKPENWGYLAGLIALLALVEWWSRTSAKKRNTRLNLDLENMSAQEIALAWTKAQLKMGQHVMFKELAYLCGFMAIGLVLVAIDQLLLAIVVMVLGMGIALSRISKLRVVDLRVLADSHFEEVKEYFALNKDAIIEQVQKDPEVIQAMAKWPKWTVKLNNSLIRRKSFRPIRNQYD